MCCVLESKARQSMRNNLIMRRNKKQNTRTLDCLEKKTIKST